MHHHGGGHIDLTAPLGFYKTAFDRAQTDPTAWVTSYGEVNAKASARFPGAMGRDIAFYWKQLVGLAETPGDVRLGGPGYSMSWTDLLGKIYQPIQLKYFERIRVDNDLHVEWTDYQ